MNKVIGSHRALAIVFVLGIFSLGVYVGTWIKANVDRYELAKVLFVRSGRMYDDGYSLKDFNYVDSRISLNLYAYGSAIANSSKLVVWFANDRAPTSEVKHSVEVLYAIAVPEVDALLPPKEELLKQITSKTSADPGVSLLRD